MALPNLRGVFIPQYERQARRESPPASWEDVPDDLDLKWELICGHVLEVCWNGAEYLGIVDGGVVCSRKTRRNAKEYVERHARTYWWIQ